MKARIKGCGQIIDIVYVETRLDTDGTHDYYAEKGTEYVFGRSLWKDTQLDFNMCNQSEFDWSSFRREAAKDILCALISNSDCFAFRQDKRAGEIEVSDALSFADELIRQLKQE